MRPRKQRWPTNMTTKKKPSRFTVHTREELLEVHNRLASERFSWAGMQSLKEHYGQSKNVIAAICHQYNVPMLKLSDAGGELVSWPALDYVLANTPELASNTGEQSAVAKVQRLQAEAEAEVKQDLRDKFTKQLETATSL